MRAPDALKLKLQVINCIHPDVGARNGTVKITMLLKLSSRLSSPWNGQPNPQILPQENGHLYVSIEELYVGFRVDHYD